MAAASPPQEKSESTILTVDTKTSTALDRIDKISQAYAVETARPALGQLSRAVVTARGIQMIREALTDQVLDFFMPLMNSPLGFKTDRAPGNKKGTAPYGKDVVREVLVQALLNDVPLTGNHLNIISAQLYITREGYEKKVGNIPGLTNLEVIPGTPQPLAGGRSPIRMGARWKMEGQPCQLLDGEGKPGRVFQIPANEYSGPDQIIGKGIRKCLKAVWDQVMGSEMAIAEPEEQPVISENAMTGPVEGKIPLRRGNGQPQALEQQTELPAEQFAPASEQEVVSAPQQVEQQQQAQAAPAPAAQAPTRNQEFSDDGEAADPKEVERLKKKMRDCWTPRRCSSWFSDRKLKSIDSITKSQAAILAADLDEHVREQAAKAQGEREAGMEG